MHSDTPRASGGGVGGHEYLEGLTATPLKKEGDDGRNLGKSYKPSLRYGKIFCYIKQDMHIKKK